MHCSFPYILIYRTALCDNSVSSQIMVSLKVELTVLLIQQDTHVKISIKSISSIS